LIISVKVAVLTSPDTLWPLMVIVAFVGVAKEPAVKTIEIEQDGIQPPWLKAGVT